MNSDKFATQLLDEYYENGKKIYAYHVCRKVTNSLYYNNQFVKTFQYFEDLKTGKIFNFSGYNVMLSNCVQVSMIALSFGEFATNNAIIQIVLKNSFGLVSPNLVYSRIWWYFDEDKMSNYIS